MVTDQAKCLVKAESFHHLSEVLSQEPPGFGNSATLGLQQKNTALEAATQVEVCRAGHPQKIYELEHRGPHTSILTHKEDPNIFNLQMLTAHC